MTINGCTQDGQTDKSEIAVSSAADNASESLVENSIQPSVEQTTANQPSAKLSTEQGAQQGRMAFIDPETGKLTSKPSQVEVLSLTESRSKLVIGSESAEPIKSRVLSDGTTLLELDDRFNKPLRAVIDENGKVQVGHNVKLDGR